MLTGSTDQMDHVHKEVYSVLADVASLAASGEYDEEDIKECTSRLESLLDDKPEQKDDKSS